MKRIVLLLFSATIMLVGLSSIVLAKNPLSDDDAVAAITKFENDAVKADLAGDSAFYEKNLVDNWTGGYSGGTWYTKESMLAEMKDTAKNKTNSEEITDLKVRVYDNTAIATYKSNYDSMVGGEHRAKTVLSTDTFVRKNGVWRQVAGHSSEAAK
ncbi:MAG: hypothetical protein DMG69_26600 [Acidobacteria bacterium]|nr:MAG: hypothetical protein DMG69_26600 [Acidobacteriota bacterium]